MINKCKELKKTFLIIDGKLLNRLFWVVLLVSFLIWLTMLVSNPHGHQKDIFYIRMNEFLGDAIHVTYMVKDNDPYLINDGRIANYPPLPYALYYLLAHAVSASAMDHIEYYYHPVWLMLFFLFLGVSLVLLHAVCVKQLSSIPFLDSCMIVLSLILSYPMLYAIERGNTVIITVLASTIYFFYYDSVCGWKKELALFCLGLATGIKLAPAAFGLLLVCRKDWKAIIRAILYTVFFLVLPFYVFQDGINNFAKMIYHIKMFFMYFTGYANVHGTGLVASYYHIVTHLFKRGYELSSSAYTMLRLISIELAFFLSIGIFHLTEKWKKILNITLVTLILPSASHEYNMLFMIPMTILFLNALVNEKVSVDKGLLFFSLLMTYFIYRSPVSDFFNYHIAILVFCFVAFYYSVKGIKKSHHILPKDFFA